MQVEQTPFGKERYALENNRGKSVCVVFGVITVGGKKAGWGSRVVFLKDLRLEIRSIIVL